MNIRLFLIFLTFLTTQVSFAVTVDNLYRAEIILPLISTEKKVIDEAYELAIEEVLVKVSGDFDAVQKVLPLARKSVSKWVAQHSITDEQNLIELDASIYSAKKVEVNFYSQSIDSFLFEQGLPVWGENRPSILLWLIEQKQFQRTVAGVESPSDLLNEITKNSLINGIPIYAPLQDERDKNSLTGSDLWGFFETPIVTASQRYETDAVSVFKVTELPTGEYEGVLMLLLSSEPTIRFDLQGKDIADLALQTTHIIAKEFSTRYAATKNQGEKSSVLVNISNIHNHETLDKVQEYLGKLGVVSEVYPSVITDNGVQFIVSLNGSMAKMTNVIDLDSVIVKVDSNDLESDIKYYRYNGKK